MVITGITIQNKTPHKLHAMGNASRIIRADPADMSTLGIGVMGRFMVHPKIPKYTRQPLDIYACEVFDALIELGCEEADIVSAASVFVREIYKTAGYVANVDPEDLEDAEDLSPAAAPSTTDSSSLTDGPETP